MAAEWKITMALKSVTVVAGPRASGKEGFGFRFRAGEDGYFRAGREPVKVDLTKPDAKKYRLEERLLGYSDSGYLTITEREELKDKQREPAAAAGN